MSLESLIQYFTQYGAVAIFVVVLLEYMNLPGFPAGVIMPLAGVWAALEKILKCFGVRAAQGFLWES